MVPVCRIHLGAANTMSEIEQSSARTGSPEPKEPMELCICIGEQWKFRKVVDRLSTHIVQCLSSHYDCGDKICGYFRWFYPGHYNQCDKKFQEGDPCISCLKLLQWVAAHAKSCHYENNCGLQLCHEVKRQWLRKSVKCYWAPQEVEQALATGMGYQNPEESLTNLRRRSSDPPTGSSEPLDMSDQYQTSYSRESSIDHSSDHHRSLLEKQESFVLPHDVSHFSRMVSQENSLKRARASVSSVHSRTSIDSTSSIDLNSGFSDVNRSTYMQGHSRASINGQSVDGSDACPYVSNPTAPIQRADSAGGDSRMVIFDNSLDMTSHGGHIVPHPHTYHNHNQSQPFSRRSLTSNQSFDKSSEIFEGQNYERRSDSGHGSPTTGTQSPSSLSSYEGSDMEAEEEEEVSYQTDDNSTLTGGSTFESTSASTPSEQISLATGLESGQMGTRQRSQLTECSVESAMANIDATLAANRTDVRMKHFGKPLKQKPALNPPKSDEELEAPFPGLPKGFSLDNDLGFPVDCVSDKILRSSKQFAKKEQEIYEQMISQPFPESVEDVQMELTYRDSIREYLQGQFYRHQAYREDDHWKRLWKLGSGGQATCYSIVDKQTNSLLALKEEHENDKTVDEAYICLKLAYLMKYEPPNIVEYFGAAMLADRNLIQLFMELVPACLQGYLFKCGPLSLETAHHFAYQLFEAVDFLHHKLKIVHCDIKPANLLINSNCQRLKVADFGCAELLEECHRGSCFRGDDRAGTLTYNPPEFYREKRCSFAFDIWQAGCSVLAMCTGRRPWRHLFMDCVDRRGKRDPQVIRIKQQYKEMIAKQLSGHMIPAFVDEGLQQLLFGCLHPDYTRRLSAQDCTYLLASAEAGTEEQKRKVVEAFGHSRTIDVLRDFSPNPHRLDVYLGYTHDATIAGLRHKLQGGWIGSVPYHDGMVYGELYGLLTFPDFPITQLIPSYRLAMCDNSPQGIWRTVNDHPGGVQFLDVSESMRVDRTKAVVILPYIQRR